MLRSEDYPPEQPFVPWDRNEAHARFGCGRNFRVVMVHHQIDWVSLAQAEQTRDESMIMWSLRRSSTAPDYAYAANGTCMETGLCLAACP